MTRLTDEEYKSVFSKTPRLTVDLVIQKEDGFLLSKRLIPPFLGSWHFPGGRVLYKETLEAAVKRVAAVELGVGVKIIKKIGNIEYLEDGEFVHSVSVVFMVQLVSQEIKASNQAKEFNVFKDMPPDMLPYQADFWQTNLL